MDYGCGKGRAVCLFAQKPFKKIYGVEVSPIWAEYANANVIRLGGCRADCIKIVNEDAVKFDPEEGTIFYFFNPFGARTFREVLSKIHDSLQRNPRRIYLVYYNTACKEVFDCEPWLTQERVIHKDLGGNPAIILYKNLL